MAKTEPFSEKASLKTYYIRPNLLISTKEQLRRRLIDRESVIEVLKLSDIKSEIEKVQRKLWLDNFDVRKKDYWKKLKQDLGVDNMNKNKCGACVITNISTRRVDCELEDGHKGEHRGTLWWL